MPRKTEERKYAITLHLTEEEGKRLESYNATLPVPPALAKTCRFLLFRGLDAAINNPELPLAGQAHKSAKKNK